MIRGLKGVVVIALIEVYDNWQSTEESYPVKFNLHLANSCLCRFYLIFNYCV